MFFLSGLIWPRPTGHTSLGTFLSKININDINIHIVKNGESGSLMEAAGEVSVVRINYNVLTRFI